MKPKIVVRSYLGYDVDAVSDETGTMCLDPSKTVQSDAVDADINTIVRRFGITGQMPVNPVLPKFQDYEEVFDYRTAVERITMAQEHFMALPAQVRIKFDNDPQKFLEFVDDPANGDELVKLGLRVPVVPEPEKVQKVEVVNPQADKK